MHDYIIEAKDVSFSYPASENEKVLVLDKINIKIERGSFVAVLGHNGSGKSTFAKICNMILQPTEGKMKICGKDASGDMTDEDILNIRKSIAMVFQNPDNQIVATVVEEDVAFGPENLGVPTDEIHKRVDMALEAVKMSEYKKHAPHQLSGGQKQRIAIAGAIAMLPECIIFDESTAMLDPNGRNDVMAIIEKLHRENGLTVIFITHYMEEAAKADRVLVMDAGKIKLDGTPREVFSHVNELYEYGLDVPQSTKLIDELEKENMKFSKTVLFPEEATDEISRALEGNK
ncbi:MAG: energy-coupling factor transporter ATPase [Clostridia bacterium]|nr:energy-coupling factor transporter ATPase [Clostridia bacterium]